MKKQMSLMVWIALMMGTACWAGEKSEPRTIVATFYPIRIALMNIVGKVEGVRVTSLANTDAGCLHDYQLTTRDMAALTKAEVLVVNGAGLESFLNDVARSRPGLQVIDASAGIDLLVSGGVTNAHVWVSPRRYILQIRRMAEGLSRWDPVHATSYQHNASAYIARLEALRVTMKAKLQGIRSREIITFHEAFSYFADEFHLTVAGVIEREPGASPSASEMASLIQVIRTTGVKTLFVEPQYPAKIAATIARETGAKIFTLDPVVTGPDLPDAYISIMEKNLAELERALR